MTKTYCDICGEEIMDWESASEFKLKKLSYSWQEYWWERLTVHTKCWVDMCDYIKNKTKEE